MTEIGQQQPGGLSEMDEALGRITTVARRTIGVVGATKLEERVLRRPDGSEKATAVVHRPDAVAVVVLRREAKPRRPRPSG